MHRFRPEPDPAALASFRVPPEDTRVHLQALIDRGLPLWVFPTTRAEDEFVVSQLLAGEPGTDRTDRTDGGELLLEVGPDSRWDAMLAEPEVVIVAFVDQVKIQLAARPRVPLDRSGLASPAAALVDRGGGDRGWRLGWSGALYRIQRRDGFRIRPAEDDPVWCHVPVSGGRTAFRVIDVSVVGVALAFPVGTARPDLGTRIVGCRLQLPGTGAGPQLLPCDLVVRQVADRPEPGLGAPVYRVGCAFEPMTLDLGRVVQRAMMDLERRTLAPDRG
ncbi:MAG: PilZ domain-containing protein [Myxococcota bacterium]